MALSFNLFSPGNLDPANSYGLFPLELGRHLAALGHHANFMPAGDRVSPLMDDATRELTTRPFVLQPGATVDLLFGYPTIHRYFSTTAGAPRLALTMFESSRMPEDWAEPLNECDAVITPSRFCRDVFRDCGVSAPVHVIPLGVSNVYRPVGRSTDRPFTFLAFLDRLKRKGGLLAMTAFVRAFGDRDDVRFVIKHRSMERASFKPKPATSVNGNGAAGNKRAGLIITNKNIEVVQADLTESELYALYSRCDCLVMPALGEGFGWPPREMAATGGIALATSFSGLADDIDLWGLPLPYTLQRAGWEGVKELQGKPLGQWAHVDVDAVAERMRWVYEQRELLRHRAMRNAPRVRELYDWSAIAGRVANLSALLLHVRELQTKRAA